MPSMGGTPTVHRLAGVPEVSSSSPGYSSLLPPKQGVYLFSVYAFCVLGVELANVHLRV